MNKLTKQQKRLLFWLPLIGVALLSAWAAFIIYQMFLITRL